MANNKRLLKKEIRLICGGLAGECVLADVTIPGIDSAKIKDIIIELADLQQNALGRINFTFPQSEKSFSSPKEYRKARQAYYKATFRKLKGEFNAHIEAIVKKMNEALPAEQKEANKKAVQA